MTDTSIHSVHVMDADVPGGVYLCQVGEHVSCGACCGLYNVADTSKASLTAMLADRTQRFADVPRTAAAIDRFACHMEAQAAPKRPFEHFHHCPFIGLIGRNRSRVGCLLHPLAEGNRGVDFRGLSYYGGLACRTYFCPTTHRLAPRYKRVVRSIIGDWHLYGLVITETELLEGLFRRLEAMLSQPIDTVAGLRGPQAVRALTALLQLKLTWPYRPSQADTVCHYFFSDPPPNARPPIDYGRLGAAPSPCNAILAALGSEFASPDELADAERRVAEHLDIAATALSATG